MGAPRWRKVFADLWGNKLRSLLVVTAIAIGVFAVGMITTMYIIVSEDMNTSYLATNPASAIIYCEPFDQDFVERIKRIPGIAAVEARSSVNIQVRTGPDQWNDLSLMAIKSFPDNQISVIEPEAGNWPPTDNELYIERTALKMLNAQIGDEVEVHLADDKIKRMRFAGVVHDQSVFSTGTTLYGHITAETLKWLHQSTEPNQLYIKVSENAYSEEHIRAIATEVSDQIKKSGRAVYFEYVEKPGEHPGTQTVQAVLGVLVILGLLAVFLGSFLVTNTLSALLTQQIRQIGMMKAVGAQTGQLIGMYVILILSYGLIGLLIAVPLSALAGYGLSSLLAGMINFDLQGFRVIPQAVGLQVIIALLVPVGAGIIPVVAGARITIREAISGYGLSAGQFGKGLIDRLVEQVRIISRPLMISLRNTFRRKGRLVLTLITLSLGGAIFISIFNVRASLLQLIDRTSRYFLSDVNLEFERSYYIDEIEEVALAVPGVMRVEGWALAVGELMEDIHTASDNVSIIAPPVDSELIEPMMAQGRWVVQGDENAIVVSNSWLKKRPDLKVGDEVVIRLNGRRITWKVVGVFQFPNDQQLLAYANYDYLSQVMNDTHKAIAFRIVTRDHSAAFQNETRKLLEARFREKGYNLSSAETGSILTESFTQIIDMLVSFFMVMSVLIAAVGSVGLTATMSMNVLERTREIGVMRAIGASTISILKLVIVEGLLIGFISWLIGTLLAIPLSQGLAEVVTQALFQSPSDFSISIPGFVLWMVIIAVLATIASLLPAWNAARLTVRDVLAYE